ncbi:MAG: tetratricopeptide repeat protein, partial [bacterium]
MKFSKAGIYSAFYIVIALILTHCATTGPQRTLKQRTVGLYVQGTQLHNNGNYIQARYLLKQAIDFDTTFAEAYYVLGLTYLKTKENNQALANFKKALRLKPVTEKPGYDEADIKFSIGVALTKREIEILPW